MRYRLTRGPPHLCTGQSDTASHLAPRGCQCSQQLRPAAATTAAAPHQEQEPRLATSATTQDPRLPDTEEAMPASGERRDLPWQGCWSPGPPSCPQPQPHRVEVCTRPSGAAWERPGPCAGNRRGDGLDGAPRTQRRPQARRSARLPSTSGKSRPGTNADHLRPGCERHSRRAVGPPGRSRWPWALLGRPPLLPTCLARTDSPRSEVSAMPAPQPPWGFLHVRDLFCASVLLIT